MKNILHLTVTGYTRNSRTNLWQSLTLANVALTLCSEDPKTLFTINQDPYVPTKGDKFYFLEKVNVPRVKLKDFHDENGTKTVRDIDQATHIFIGQKTIELYMRKDWCYKASTEFVKHFFELGADYFDNKQKEDIRQALEFYTEPFMYINYQFARLCTDDSLPFSAQLKQHPEYNKEEGLEYSIDVFSINAPYVPIYNQLSTLSLTDEACLISVLNGTNAAVIDEEMFDRLSAMFSSNDRDNWVLAMEIMANSQYEKSLYYLELLFKEYSGKIYDIPTKRHVNFKSLTTHLGKSSYFGTRLDDVVKSLIEKNVLTHDMLTDLMHRYKQEIIDKGDSTYFRVKDITVTEELHSIVNKNFTYNLIEDYVPEVKEVVAPEEEVISDDFLNYIPTDEEATFTELAEEPIEVITEVVEEELPGTEVEVEVEVESVVEIQEEIIVEPKKEEDESEIDWF